MKGAAFKLLGTRELYAALVQLEGVTAARIVRQAEAEALQPVADVARRLAPVRVTPNKGRSASLGQSLRSTIGVGTRLTKRQKKISQKLGQVETYVGPGLGPSGHGARHAHLVEFGTKQRYTKGRNGKKIKSTGAMPAHPYMEPAWDGQMNQVWNRMVRFMSNKLERLRLRGKIT